MLVTVLWLLDYHPKETLIGYYSSLFNRGGEGTITGVYMLEKIEKAKKLSDGNKPWINYLILTAKLHYTTENTELFNFHQAYGEKATVSMLH